MAHLAGEEKSECRHLQWLGSIPCPGTVQDFVFLSLGLVKSRELGSGDPPPSIMLVSLAYMPPLGPVSFLWLLFVHLKNLHSALMMKSKPL